MREPSSAFYDFVVLTSADRLEPLGELLLNLRDRFGTPGPEAELCGKPDSGEVRLLLRFPFAHYSAALRAKVEREAGLLKARLVEPSLLAAGDRARLYECLGGPGALVVVGADPREAIAALREKLGMHKAVPTLVVRFETADGLAEALATSAAEGALTLPRARPFPPGSAVALSLQAPGLEPMVVGGSVAEVVGAGLKVTVQVTPEVEAFIGRQAARRKEGRRRPEGGARKHARYDTFLEVSFDSGARLRDEYVRNIGRGGLFVRSEAPPPLRTTVRLRLKLPDGSVAETNAEVVHLVTVDEARARRTAPGAGLAFATGDTLFQRAIGQFVEGAGRKLRALVADDDERLRSALCQALTREGYEVQQVADGLEAMARLGGSLIGLDLLIIDLDLPQVDGLCLVDRVRRLGPELDLRIAVLTEDKDAPVVKKLVAPGGADIEIRRGTPLEEILARLQQLLAR